MKISVAITFDSDDGSANEMVVQNLRDVGFSEQPDADGNLHLTFDGDISPNDLAYGASMLKSMGRR